MYHLQEVRNGDWMQSYSGKEMYPIDMRLDELHIVDIAGALSKQCRYAGHCLRFYSVAEHSVYVARYAPDELKLTALLHDASEYVLVDIPRPVKPHLSNYTELEDKIMRVVAKKFGIQWPLPREVKVLDNGILNDERDQNMSKAPKDWGITDPPLGVKIECWDPDKAYGEFMRAFYQYGGK